MTLPSESMQEGVYLYREGGIWILVDVFRVQNPPKLAGFYGRTFVGGSDWISNFSGEFVGPLDLNTIAETYLQFERIQKKMGS